MVVVIGPIVATHGSAPLAAVTMLAGVVVVIAGVMRLGRAVTYIPWPVIEGFTLGIALIIFLQQVPAALGTRAGASSNAAYAAVQSFGSARPSTFIWSLAALAVVAAAMVLAPRLHPRLPGSILGILVVAVAVAAGRPRPADDRIAALTPAAPALPGLDGLGGLLSSRR